MEKVYPSDHKLRLNLWVVNTFLIWLQSLFSTVSTTQNTEIMLLTNIFCPSLSLLLDDFEMLVVWTYHRSRPLAECHSIAKPYHHILDLKTIVTVTKGLLIDFDWRLHSFSQEILARNFQPKFLYRGLNIESAYIIFYRLKYSFHEIKCKVWLIDLLSRVMLLHSVVIT